MKTKINIISLLLIFFVPLSMWAQCPGSFSVSVATTATSCPSNGSATITTSPTATSSFTYTITAGPAGTLLNTAQSSNVFNALLPGNYTIEVSCGAAKTSAFFTILDSYTPITNVTGTVSGTCTSYAPGGNVTISATGGRAPLLYSIIKSNDPNYADALSAYSSSPNKTVNSFGTYQVRVKDACNQFYTSTVQVAASMRPAVVYYGAFDSTTCGATGYNFYYDVIDASTWSSLDLYPYNAAGGIKVNVYEKSATAWAPTGPLLLSFIADKIPSHVYLPAVSSMQYYSEVITPCGDTAAHVDDASHTYDVNLQYMPFTSGCGGSSDPLIEDIKPYAWTPGIVFPLTVKLYRGTSTSGTLVGTKTANSRNDIATGGINFDNLVPDIYYMSATDACGNVITQYIPDPTTAGSPHLTYQWSQLSCSGAGVTTQSGATTVIFSLDGFLAGSSSFTAVIISGPSGIGSAAAVDRDKLFWSNLLPGNYIAAITTSCGTVNLSFTVLDDPNYTLKQNITASGTTTCGTGSGIITATTDYNGVFTRSFVLTNAATHAGVDSNTSGVFNSVAPGEYYVRLKLVNNTWCTYPDYYINSSNVVIAAASAGPQITRKLGVVCEDVSGSSLTTGTAYLTIAGGSPLLVEYKLTSSSAWLTHSTNAPSEVQIGGLTTYQVYDIRVTSCGITTATQATIGNLTTIPTDFNHQPCVGSPYQLALPQLPGATYEWKNASGNVVSTSYNYNIASYNTSYNGKYTATTFFGSCAKRTDTVTLNSAMCGSTILPSKFISFAGKSHNCATKLNWKISDAVNLLQITLERSFNGKDYTNLFNTGMSNEGSYIDESNSQGQIYYRLKMNTADNNLSYSNPVIINANCNIVNTQWSLFPVVLQSGGMATVKLNTTNNSSTNINIIITSITGQRIRTYEVTTHKGQNIYPLTDLKLVSGTYLVSIYDKKGMIIGRVQKLICNK